MSARLIRRFAFALAAVCGAAMLSASAPASVPPRPAEFLPHEGRASGVMVVSANPLATQAGLEVLRRGGSAVDAAVAVQAVLGLVEPQSSGLGGGAFMTFYDGKTRQITAYNGRETAPAGARPDMFLDARGEPVGYARAVLGGHSTGVPGAVAMLALAQKEHGKLAWSSLFGAAERLGREGFVVSPRLNGMIHGRFPQTTAPDVKAYFARAGGGLLQTGDVLRNPDYAATVRRLAAEGPRAILAGPIGADIVAKVQAADPPGALTLADLAGYRPKVSAPVCAPYRQWVLCGPPPPAGAAVVLEALGILEHTDIGTRGPNDPQAWYLLAEAQRLAYADRDRYMGDPDFVKVPTRGLLDPAYLAARAKLIGEVAGPAPEPGRPAGAPEAGADATQEPTGTSHMVIVDAAGNVVSMTTTVESIFGSGRMTHGFFLNNQLTDFSFRPVDRDGRPAANAVAPGKRPRSSMSPFVILDRQGRFVGAVGSAGGSAIIAYDLKAIVAMLDWGMSPQAALALPNLIAHGESFMGEADKLPPGVAAYLAARGAVVRPGQGEDSGLTAVMVRGGVLVGGADPRREGTARGW